MLVGANYENIEIENEDRSRRGPINQAGVIPAIESSSDGLPKSLYASLAKSKYSFELPGDSENMTPLPISGKFFEDSSVFVYVLMQIVFRCERLSQPRIEVFGTPSYNRKDKTNPTPNQKCRFIRFCRAIYPAV
jgi:hypothetical protein